MEENSMETDENCQQNLQQLRMTSQIQDVCKSIEKEMKDSFATKKFFDTAMRLSQIFGEDVVVDGMSIAENGSVRLVRDEGGLMPLLYEVRSDYFCSHSYYIYQSVHFCKCSFFSKRVIFKEKAFMVGLHIPFHIAISDPDE